MSNSADTNGLARYDAMCRAIDAAHGVDEVKDIRDKALALAVYARQAKNTEAERKASEIRLRAERRVGTLLGEASKSGQRDSGRGGNRRSPPPETVLPTLNDYGITKTQSSQWQQLSSIPEGKFEAIIRRAEKPTTNSVLSAAIPAKKKTSRISADARWLVAFILDCKSRGVFEREPSTVLLDVPHWALDDVRHIAPRAAAWLKRPAECPS